MDESEASVCCIFFFHWYLDKQKAKKKNKDGNELFLTYIHLKKHIRATSPRSFKSVLMTVWHLSNSTQTEIYPLSRRKKRKKKKSQTLFVFEIPCVQDLSGEPHSHSCNPERWRGPSTQPFRNAPVPSNACSVPEHRQ